MMGLLNDQKTKRSRRLSKVLARAEISGTIACAVLFFSSPAKAAEDSKVTAAPAVTASTPKGYRNFYVVMDDLLADFEYDLKNGQVNGLKDMSIRTISLSENIPPSFRTQLDLSVTERILKTSNTKVIQCLACRAKRTQLNGDQMTISTAETNPIELARIAKQAGIQNFMDIAFSFQSTGMVLAMTISSPDTGAVIWSRSYNSETSRTSAIRRGVDVSLTDDARRQAEYVPAIQYRISLGYLFEPETSGTTGCLALGFRMMERYDNRHKEVGFELNTIKQAASIVGSATSTPTNLWSGFNLTAVFLHHWNLIQGEENFNQVRGTVSAGIGGTYASGYLGGLFRGGYEWRLGKHWSLNTLLGYRPSATRFIGAKSLGSMSGVEFGVGIGALF